MDNLRLLRQMQHKNVTLETILKFRENHNDISWTELTYKNTGDSVLHIAARLGQEEIVNYILREWPPFNIDFKNNDCKTALHEAAQFSQEMVVEILLKNGAEKNSIKRADWTPLMLACTKTGQQSYNVIKCLLNYGASVSLMNKDGWTAFHVACRAGDVNIVQLLLNYKSDIFSTSTFNGRTSLHIACLHGHLQIVQLLLKNCKMDVNQTDNCGNIPLHDAVCSGNIDLVQLLVSSGANIKCVNKAHLSCLHLAASEGLISMIHYLICDLRMDPNITGLANITPLHCAARLKNVDVFKYLIQLGADINIRDVHGRLPNDYLLL